MTVKLCAPLEASEYVYPGITFDVTVKPAFLRAALIVLEPSRSKTS